MDAQICIEKTCDYLGGPDPANFPEHMYCFKAKKWLSEMEECLDNHAPELHTEVHSVEACGGEAMNKIEIEITDKQLEKLEWLADKRQTKIDEIIRQALWLYLDESISKFIELPSRSS